MSGVTGARRVAVVPPAPALLRAYASLTDPVPDLRRAATEAVAWLGGDGEGQRGVRVLADDEQARRVGEELLGRASVDDARDVLVMANGSARRSEKAPGHLDPRAADFDARLGELLAAGDLAGVADLARTPAGPTGLADELLAAGLAAFALLDEEGVEVSEVEIDHAGDPFGVMYWVVRFQCGS